MVLDVCKLVGGAGDVVFYGVRTDSSQVNGRLFRGNFSNPDY